MMTINKLARKMLLDYIRAQAREKGISHNELARRSGLIQSNVTRMLAGKYSPTLDNLIRLAEAANCHLFVIDKEADDDLCETMRTRWGKPSKN